MNNEGLKIFLFGKPCIRIGENVISGFDSIKVLELFCYILIHRSRPLLRDMLCGLLWADMDDARTKKYLRQALWQLQSVLNQRDGSEEMALLQVDANWVRVNQGAGFWFDVAEFEQAYEQTASVQGRALKQSEAQALDLAARLYSGDLLEGWYQDWCLFERERLQAIYIHMLDKLVEYSLYHREYEHGIQRANQILRFDHAHERTYLQLMKLNYLLGDRTAALRQFQRCVAALADELGVKPSRETLACYEQIQADQLRPPGSTIPVSGRAGGKQLLREVLDRLQQIKGSVEDLQAQIRREINEDYD